MGKEKSVKNKEDKVGLGKLLLWQSRGVAKTPVILILAFLMTYCTDTLKIPAATISILLIVSKLVDGVTDMAAGFIVDKTKTKWGKGRPYEVFIVALWICTWLLYSCPENASILVKCVWVFVMYALVNSICLTFLNANETPYLVRAFRDKQIVKLTSYGSVVTMLVAVIFNIFFPILMGSIATSAAGWSKLILMFAVPCVAIGLLRMIFIPEKYNVDGAVNTENKEEKLKVSDVAALVKTNKFILIISLMTFIFNFVVNMGVQVYYFKYIVGDVRKMALTAVITFVSIPLAFVFPQLLKKMAVVKLMAFGFLISAFGYFLNGIAGSNMGLLMLGSFCTGTGTVPASMLIALPIIQCADYNEWIKRPRMEGTMSSLNGLAGKIGATVGAGALGLLLSAAGYTGDAATTSEASLTMIRLLYGFIPMALYILGALSLKFYKLDKLMPQIKAEIEERRGNVKQAEN